jgi:ribosome-associated toxin RatA of RatAB toxin-antitoxin module
MFDLVDDVDSYDRFLPWCRKSTVLERTEDTVKGTIVFAKGGFERGFTTLNRRQPGKMIEIRLVEGPFRHLEGFWRFQPLRDDASKVSLDLEFEFNNRLVAMAFGKVFTQVANTLVDSFVSRAREVYQ